MIAFDNVGLRYGHGPEILRDVTFSISPGSFHFLTGPSGSGKTSLLRLLLLSLKPTRGSVSMFGEDVSALERDRLLQMRRHIGIVFQEFRLLDHLTTFENVALPLRVRGQAEASYRSNVEELLDWVGLGDRHRLGLAFNEMVRNGELKAPVVIGRDHLDSGSVASPNRETEAMKDGSDAVSDWPLLNALLNTASGATWVSLHHGGGVGMGFSQHSGVVICCDGSEEAARRIERVLWNDPATGVMRHADAGYDIALDCAREKGLRLPGILGN